MPLIIGNPKIVIAAYGFTSVCGSRQLSWLSGNSVPTQPWQTYVKSETAITVFGLLMMSGVSPKTCWGIKNYWNNNLYYTVASCWFFLWDLENSVLTKCMLAFFLGIKTLLNLQNGRFMSQLRAFYKTTAFFYKILSLWF